MKNKKGQNEGWVSGEDVGTDMTVCLWERSKDHFGQNLVTGCEEEKGVS